MDVLGLNIFQPSKLLFSKNRPQQEIHKVTDGTLDLNEDTSHLLKISTHTHATRLTQNTIKLHNKFSVVVEK